MPYPAPTLHARVYSNGAAAPAPPRGPTPQMVDKIAAAHAFAVKCWILTGEVVKAAVRLMRESWPRRYGKLPRHPSTFMRQWVKRFQESRLFTNRPGRGRKTTCSNRLLNTAAAMFVTGYYIYTPARPEGEHHGYSSMDEACRVSPAIAHLVAAAGVTPCTFWQHMHTRHPEIRRYARDYKPTFSAIQQAKRVARAREWLRMEAAGGAAWRRQLVFFDEGSIELRNATSFRRHEYYLEGDPRARMVLHLPLPAGCTSIELRFFVAVNAVAGPLFI